MNGFPSREQVKRIREGYPVGTRIELRWMDDLYTKLKTGDKGTVRGVDDAGQIMVDWDCGSTLSLIPGVDGFNIIKEG